MGKGAGIGFWAANKAWGFVVLVFAVSFGLVLLVGPKDAGHAMGSGMGTAGIAGGITIGSMPKFFHGFQDGRTYVDGGDSGTVKAKSSKK